MKKTLLIVLSSIIIIAAGCVTTQQPPAPPPTISLSVKIPEITAIEKSESQEKGGIEITIVPAIYKPVQKESGTITAIQPDFGMDLHLAGLMRETGRQHVYVRESWKQYLDTDPARLVFTIRVNNKLDRVFRGQGTVFQLNVGGKLIPFGDIDYKEIVEGIVPPRNENTFVVRGPRINTLPETGMIGIYLYDVVTATDVAGNVTERQNYEWFFEYKMSEITETVQKRRDRIYPMELSAYRQKSLQFQQGQY